MSGELVNPRIAVPFGVDLVNVLQRSWANGGQCFSWNWLLNETGATAVGESVNWVTAEPCPIPVGGGHLGNWLLSRFWGAWEGTNYPVPLLNNSRQREGPGFPGPCVTTSWVSLSPGSPSPWLSDKLFGRGLRTVSPIHRVSDRLCTRVSYNLDA